MATNAREQRLAFTQQHLLHHLAVGQHGDDELAVGEIFGRRGGGAAQFRRHLRRASRHRIVQAHVEALAHQVGSHGPAHGPHADEADPGGAHGGARLTGRTRRPAAVPPNPSARRNPSAQ